MATKSRSLFDLRSWKRGSDKDEVVRELTRGGDVLSDRLAHLQSTGRIWLHCLSDIGDKAANTTSYLAAANDKGFGRIAR